ncbi:contractile injection system protein, VgrG/Pvc8 family [Leptolyngbya sp. FACHB-17]|uniref:phage late control D family protein n=1 Tax=unclassified Leptolyngbya TaxID=2650499 RepID=UPI0018F03D93|nr:contractile injection system protein, VgrG/Pvc8 family [Leptolyngbya sp. FACHB-17]
MFSTVLTSQIPNYAISINNAPMLKLAEDVESITVTEDLEAPSMIAMTLNTYDEINDKLNWVDDSRLSPGNEIAISLGYGNTLETVIVGEITGLEPEFSQEQGSTVTVRGHDRRHRLLRGTHTNTFIKLKDSQIAQQIASQNGLLAKVTDTKVSLDYVLQNNVSDLAFLQTRSQRIGYEVWIEDKTLHFQPPQYRTLALTTLEFEQDVLEFSPRLSLLSQVTQVEVRGWNWKTKQAIVSQSGDNSIASMGGSQIGVRASQRAFGAANRQIGDQPVQSKAEADAMAQGQLEERALHYITGEGTCMGNPKIRAGSVIEVKGVGKRFSGRYYVVAVTHTMSGEAGYRTEFTVRRTAA